MVDNMPTTITAVLFDWDLTLAQVLGEVSHSERLTALFQLEGLPFTHEQVQAALHSYQAEQNKLPQSGMPQTQQDIANFYRQILVRLGHQNVNQAFVNRLYDAYALLPITLYKDALTTLRAIKRAKLEIGIISNHSNVIRPVIEKYTGGLVSPSSIIISQEEGVHKPAKTIFARAAARMQTAPENCLFVGDNLVVDAIGAVTQGEFGMGLWLDRNKKGATMMLPTNVHRITSLTQVLNFV